MKTPQEIDAELEAIVRRCKYEGYLRSPTWAAKRRQKLFEAGYVCEKCGGDCKLDVHHKTYAHLFDEPLTDLIVLCRYCHKVEHSQITVEDKFNAQQLPRL